MGGIASQDIANVTSDMGNRRNRVPGGTYFFTVNLANRRSDLLVRDIETLRAAIRAARLATPLHIDAWEILQDHMLCIWTLPKEDTDYSGRWRAIKNGFQKPYQMWNRYGPRFWRARGEDLAIFNPVIIPTQKCLINCEFKTNSLVLGVAMKYPTLAVCAALLATGPAWAQSLTGPQINAARSAKQYISMSGFSRSGLIQQLSSDAGDGYSISDATVAVDVSAVSLAHCKFLLGRQILVSWMTLRLCLTGLRF